MTNSCSINKLFNQISKMWVLKIIREIASWKNSFNEIKKSLWSISSKTLSDRLKDLVADWFISKEIVSTTPLKVRYIFTKKWESFYKEIENLNKWADNWDY